MIINFSQCDVRTENKTILYNVNKNTQLCIRQSSLGDKINSHFSISMSFHILSL